MLTILKAVLFLSGLVVSTGFVFYQVALYQGGNASNWKNGGYHAAPGPIAGAGLPVLAIGYGVYWLIKRRRKTD